MTATSPAHHGDTTGMWKSLLRAMDAAADATNAWTIDAVAALMHDLTPDALAPVGDADEPLPWGRYLVHADPAGRYNLQLDVFSPGYQGEVHAHDTWGIFWVLRGVLMVVDDEFVGAAVRPQRASRLGPGASQCFCPPASDWHRVATPAGGPQTVSLHLYGPGFDLDVGRSFVAGEPRTYRRRPFGELTQVSRAFRARPA